MDRFCSTGKGLNKEKVVSRIGVPWFTDMAGVTTHKKIRKQNN